MLSSVRSDAARNQSAILSAAHRLVVERGPDVAMDEIAREARVAVGTLYRHFPTKADLVAAVLEDSVARIADEADAAVASLSAGRVPADAIATLFRAVAERHGADRSLKAAARRIGVPVPVVDGSTDTPATARARERLQALLDAAAAAQALAAPTSLVDMMVLLDGVPDPALGEAARDRYADVVLRGLFATGA